MNHQSRFKSYLVEPRLLQQELSSLRSYLNEILVLQRKGLHPSEVVLLFISSYLQVRSPNSWWMKSGQQIRDGNESSLKVSELSDSFSFLKKLEIQNLNDFLIFYRPRKLPHALFAVLRQWMSGRYDLILSNGAPTSWEMLRLQAEGKRIVTLDWGAANSGQYVDGRRDAFEFLLHDLIHADLFFRDDLEHRQQATFFCSLLQILRMEKDFEAPSGEFARDLDYLMSDMNSNIHHLQSQWRAILIKFFLNLEEKGPQGVLTPGAQVRVDALCAQIEEPAKSL